VKTLHIIDSLGAGGAERSLLEIVRRLPDFGIDPMVIGFQHRPEGVEAELRASGVPTLILGRKHRAALLSDLRHVVTKVRPALVHTSLYESDVLGRLACFGGPPVLTSLVNTSYGPHRLADPAVRREKLAAAKFIDSWTARYMTAHFHSISHAVKNDAVRTLRINPTAVTVVPRGRDSARLGQPSSERRRRTRRRLCIPEEATVALNVARQEHQKGQRILLEAAATLGHQSDIVWLIAGREGNATEGLNALHRELGLKERVQFLGHREDIPDLLCAADVFVFPSLYEGLGGALLEAMALGVPIVASNIPAIREVLDGGRAGVLVPTENSAALAASVVEIGADRQAWQALSARASARFAREYTLDRMLYGMVELFRDVASAAHSTSSRDWSLCSGPARRGSTEPNPLPRRSLARNAVFAQFKGFRHRG
jgi:glycosyltransferase involved in cell wall biosynthesis